METEQVVHAKNIQQEAYTHHLSPKLEQKGFKERENFSDKEKRNTWEWNQDQISQLTSVDLLESKALWALRSPEEEKDECFPHFIQH